MSEVILNLSLIIFDDECQKDLQRVGNTGKSGVNLSRNKQLRP